MAIEGGKPRETEISFHNCDDTGMSKDSCDSWKSYCLTLSSDVAKLSADFISRVLCEKFLLV